MDALPEPVLQKVTAAEAAPEAASVAFAKSGKTVPCPCCTRGVCGTCNSRLLSGQVDMQHGGIRPREIEQGMVLICCSRPLEDVVIDR